MSFPRHPQEIVLRNDFYPRGLKEIDIYNYYMKVKDKILQQVAGRDLFFVVAIDENRTIIFRHGQITRFLRLNSSNYERVIHGRVVGIHSTMHRLEDIAIVDVDTLDFSQAKQAALDTYNFLKKLPRISNVTIRFTGKTGFHVFCELDKKYDIDATRNWLNRELEASELSEAYSINAKKRIPGVTNLDLAPNKFRGGFITLYSLSSWGLRCLPLMPKQLPLFRREDAKIEVS